MKDTVFLIKQMGMQTHERVYTIQSTLGRMNMQGSGGMIIETEYEDLDCNVDMRDVYYGTRECRAGKFQLDISHIGGGPDRMIVLLQEVADKNRVVLKQRGVSSESHMGVGKIMFRENIPGEKLDVNLTDVKMTVYSNGTGEETYRSMMDFVANPPVDKRKKAVTRALWLLGEFFKKVSIGSAISVAKMEGEISDSASGERTLFGLEHLKFGIDWDLADEVNLSRKLILSSLWLHQIREGEKLLVGEARDFTLDIRIEKLYNVFPELAALMMDGIHSFGTGGSVPDTFRELREAGRKALHKGLTIRIDPLALKSLYERGSRHSRSFDTMHLELKMDLQPNRLDPYDPMAFILVLAYLRAEGKVVLKKKDFQQLLPFFDPGIRVMLKRYVVYEGENTIFDLRFEQGDLKINGKSLQ